MTEDRFTTDQLLGEFTIDAGVLITALKAVAPHAGSDPERPDLMTIHVDVAGGLLVWATDTYTAGLHRLGASGLDDYDGTVWRFDLHPADAKLICTLFKPGKDEQITLHVQASSEQVAFVDVSGMFAGRELVVPNTDSGGERAPLPELLRETLAKSTTTSIAGVSDWATQGALWGRFAKSAQVIGLALIVETGEPRHPFILTCGEDFAGMLMPLASGDDDPQVRRDLRKSWIRVLPERAAAAAAA